jgi:hypothetical protein
VNMVREQRRDTAIARQVFCMFPLHLAGNVRCATVRERQRRKEMKPNISIAVYACFVLGNKVPLSIEFEKSYFEEDMEYNILPYKNFER